MRRQIHQSRSRPKARKLSPWTFKAAAGLIAVFRLPNFFFFVGSKLTLCLQVLDAFPLRPLPLRPSRGRQARVASGRAVEPAQAPHETDVPCCLQPTACSTPPPGGTRLVSGDGGVGPASTTPVLANVPITLNWKDAGIVVLLECEADAYLFEDLIYGFQLKEQTSWQIHKTRRFEKSIYPEVWFVRDWPAVPLREVPQRDHELELRRDRKTPL